MKYSYLIIEDNPKAIESLRLFMNGFPLFKEKGIAHNVKKGVLLAMEQKPDLIFLDVELENGNGFELIKELKSTLNFLPKIIMTTSHDYYAKEAVNNDVFYFISKPYDPDEIEIALRKFEKIFIENQSQIHIKNAEGHHIINLEDIIMVMSDGNYSHIFKKDLKIITSAKSITDIEEKLPLNFMRIHKSYVINNSFIELFNSQSKTIILSSEQPLTHIKNKICERENIDLKNLSVSNKTISAAHKNSHKVVLPVGKIYLEKVKLNLFLN